MDLLISPFFRDVSEIAGEEWDRSRLACNRYLFGPKDYYDSPNLAQDSLVRLIDSFESIFTVIDLLMHHTLNFFLEHLYYTELQRQAPVVDRFASCCMDELKTR